MLDTGVLDCSDWEFATLVTIAASDMRVVAGWGALGALVAPAVPDAMTAAGLLWELVVVLRVTGMAALAWITDW